MTGSEALAGVFMPPLFPDVVLCRANVLVRGSFGCRVACLFNEFHPTWLAGRLLWLHQRLRCIVDSTSATFVGAGTSGNTGQKSIEQRIVLLNFCLLCSRIFTQQMSVSLGLQTLHSAGNGLHISHIEQSKCPLSEYMAVATMEVFFNLVVVRCWRVLSLG